MIALPTPPRHAHLQAFALALALLAGLAVAVLLSLLAAPHPLVISIGIAAGAGLLGLVAAERVRPLYFYWNKTAASVARPLRGVLLRVCFHAVFVPLAKAGARFGKDPATPTASGWVARRPEPETNVSPFAAKPSASGPTTWLGSYAYWARSTGNLWALGLVPFLLLLALLAEDEDDTMPAYIYTLF